MVENQQHKSTKFFNVAIRHIRVFLASDFILFHPEGDSLAWLMFQIKARYGSLIDSMTIAKCMKTQIDLGLSARDSMLITASKMDDLMLYNYAGKK